MPGTLTESVERQIAGLDLDRAKPLIICDADEVLLQFVKGLDLWLRTRDLYLDLKTFAITGNIKHTETEVPWPADQVKPLLKEFFLEGRRQELAVPGAARALADLARKAQVVVLTNVAEAARDHRIQALIELEMPYPVVANEGAKGAAAMALAEQAGRPVIFLDDLPPNISSVRRGLPDAHIIHFVGDPHLATLIGQAPDSDHRIDDWPTARQTIETILDNHSG